MASSMESDFQHILECSVCLLRYELPMRTPKILCCGHTFCISCLQSLETGHQLTCPTCRTVCDTKTGVQGIASNHMTISLLDTLCMVCREGIRKEKCPHCDQVICTSCIEQHKSMLIHDTKEKLDSLQELLKSTEGVDPDSWLDDVHEQSCLLRTEIIEIIAAENKTFLENERLKRETFFEEQCKKQQQLLDEVSQQQKLKTKDKLVQLQRRRELIDHLFGKIEPHKKQLEGNSTIHQIHQLFFSVTQLQNEIQSGTNNNVVSDIRDCGEASKMLGTAFCNIEEVVERTSDQNLPRPMVSATLLYYRKVNKPRFVLCDTSDTQSEQGYFHITVSLKNGSIFVADWGSKCIIHIDESGQLVKRFGSDSDYPRGIAIDSKGNIVVSVGSSVQFFKPDGKFTRKVGGNGEKRGQFGAIWGITYGQDDTLYAADFTNSRVQVLYPDGQWLVHSVFGNWVSTVALCPDGTLLVGVKGEHPELWRCDPDGSKSRIRLHGRYMEERQFDNDYGFNHICVDNDGYILLADRGYHCILVTDMSGYVHCKIGEKGTRPGQFSSPAGVALTRDGRLIVTERGQRRIQMF